MSDRTPVWSDGFDFKPWAPPDLNWTWLWVRCRNPFCCHVRAVPLGPWRIRWGEADTRAAIRRNFRCGVCGTKGCDLHEPRLDYEGIETFPVGKELRMAGPRQRVRNGSPEME